VAYRGPSYRKACAVAKRVWHKGASVSFGFIGSGEETLNMRIDENKISIGLDGQIIDGVLRTIAATNGELDIPDDGIEVFDLGAAPAAPVLDEPRRGEAILRYRERVAAAKANRDVGRLVDERYQRTDQLPPIR
jgi:hypothetical protein